MNFYIFSPSISHPARVTGNCKTLLDNILFCNHISKEAIYGNLTSTISDHLPQILFIKSIFQAILYPNPML